MDDLKPKQKLKGLTVYPLTKFVRMKTTKAKILQIKLINNLQRKKNEEDEIYLYYETRYPEPPKEKMYNHLLTRQKKVCRVS